VSAERASKAVQPFASASKGYHQAKFDPFCKTTKPLQAAAQNPRLATRLNHAELKLAR
jgi:hypothetical protein